MNIIKNKWVNLILTILLLIFTVLTWTCHVFKIPTVESCDQIRTPSIWVNFVLVILLIISTVAKLFSPSFF